MSQPTVTRWRRFGHDRVYVERPDGAKVGWWDLMTDCGHAESPELLADLEDAVRTWRSKAGGGAETGDAAPGPVPTERAAWTDLAEHRPGAAVRAQAVAAREAAPVRSTLARVLRVHTQERAWRIGAEGEEKVAAQLDRLARKHPGWRFLHAVPVGNRGADIDHIAIGPAGVFTINAKNHPGSKIWVGGDVLMVDGHRHAYVRNSRHEAARAARLLSAATGIEVPVSGLVVPVNAANVAVKQQPDDVTVVPRRRLADGCAADRPS